MTNGVHPITSSADLEDLATAMHEHLAKQPGNIAEMYVQIEHGEDTLVFQLILRPEPGTQRVQLCTVGQGRHWPTERRAELCAAFGVPEGVHPRFDIVKGWQIAKWTWEPVRVEQLSFVPPDGPAARYYRE